MIVLLTFYAERSARQVGDEMTMTEGNVRVTRHRAIGKLRACMSAAGAVQ
jgi:DNA-directed RNA polymerase specialized sigma24 family protein